MTDLEIKIVEAQDAYYNEEPIMSDEEFDALWDKLKKEQPNSFLFAKVGEDFSNIFSKEKHIMNMGSLEKVNNEKDFQDWWKKRIRTSAIVQSKMDGISIELQYKNGNLFKAVTRGNGCLDRESVVEFEDGSLRTIEDIVKNRVKGKVKSYNNFTRSIEFKEIENYFINDNNEDWYEVELEDGKVLKLTGNHQIFDKVSNKYVKTNEIKEGDVLLVD